MRIPEPQELARLVELYGPKEGARIMQERQFDRLIIDPLVKQGLSLKRICRKLARKKHPELYL